jgi:hypothetical protein
VQIDPIDEDTSMRNIVTVYLVDSAPKLYKSNEGVLTPALSVGIVVVEMRGRDLHIRSHDAGVVSHRR